MSDFSRNPELNRLVAIDGLLSDDERDVQALVRRFWLVDYAPEVLAAMQAGDFPQAADLFGLFAHTHAGSPAAAEALSAVLDGS